VKNRHSQITALALTLVASIGPAKAVMLSTTGVGQALIYPYYTVNKSQDTYLSISNMASGGVVAKVNFLEGRNGRPALDLVVYLSGNDNWSAVITQTSDNGGAVLRTLDTSCTTPAIPPAGLLFSAAGFDGSGDLPADDGPPDITRTREGSIEVISGGAILYPTPTAIAIEPSSDSGIPPGCASLPGSMIDDITASGDSLYGYAAVINVGEGIYYPYDAIAIGDFSDVPLFTESTGPLEPSLAQANSADATAPDTAIAYFSVTDAFPFLEVVHKVEFERGIDAVSALFMAHMIQNDFLTSPALGAVTDWVVQYPTLRFYRDPIYPTYPGLFSTSGEVAPYEPSGGRTSLPIGPDTTRDNVQLPYNVNVIGLSPGDGGPDSPVFGSLLGTHLDAGAESGTMRLDIHSHRTGGELALTFNTGLESHEKYLWGVPVTGFMAYNIVNANAQPGKLANYGGTFRHRTSSCMRIASIYARVCPTF
jgi:hypothetical protein